MTNSARSDARDDGMLDAIESPSRIKATVIEPGEEPRLHGYAVESDLAHNYKSSEILYLALSGELPATPDISAAFEVTLVFLSCVGANEGPTHAALLARLCNAPSRALLEVAAVGLAERAHFVVEGLGALLQWLSAAEGPPPQQYCTADPGAERTVARLRARLPSSFAVPALAHPLSRPAAIAAVLHACGLRRPDQLEAVWTLAAIGPTFAEGLAAKPFGIREYPMNLPAFRYEVAP